MAEIGIFVGTMYGNSLLVAEEAEAILARQGHSATVFEDPELSDWQQYQDKVALVVTSTTGRSRRASPIPGLKTGELYFPEVNPSPLREGTFSFACVASKQNHDLYTV